MALDPSIALGYRPPQVNVPVPQPLEQFGQVLSLRDLMQQGQLRGIQMQAAMLALQQQQQSLQNRQGLAGYLASLSKPVPPVAPATSQPEVPVVPPVSSDTGIAGPPSGAFWMPQPSAAPTTVPQTASAAIAPAATAQPSGAATAPLTIPLAGGSIGTFPNIDYSKLMQFGPEGMAMAKTLADQEKTNLENQQKKLENTAKFHARIAADAQSVNDAKDPEAAKNRAVWQLHTDGLIDDSTAREWLARPYDRDMFQQIARAGSDVKTQSEIVGTNIDNFRKAGNAVAQSLQGVNDQPSWDAAYATWTPEMQKRWGKVYSPELKSLAVHTGIDPDKYPKFRQEEIEGYAGRLSAAMKQGQDIYQTELSKLPLHDQYIFLGATTADEIRDRARTAAEQETARHNQREEELTAQGHTQTYANQIASQEDKLRDDYRQDSGKFSILRDSYDRIKTVGKGTPTAASDIALLYNYMKFIDPTSRVAEGKYATAENAGSVPDWVKSTYNRLMNGEKLDEDQRNNILKTTEDLYQVEVRNQENLKQQYRGTAKRRGLDANNIIVDAPSSAAAPSAGTGEAPAGSIPALKQTKPGDEPKMVWYGPDGQEYTKPPAVRQTPAQNAPRPYMRTAVGPNGHVIGSNDGKTWYDVQTGKAIQ